MRKKRIGEMEKEKQGMQGNLDREKGRKEKMRM